MVRPPNVSFVEPKQWIALIMRTPTKFGNCSFDLKVFNAQNAGYSAVIIYNSESDSLIRMSSSGAYKIFIPSVFIGRSSGILIDSAYTYKNKTLVIITNDDADLSYLLIPFICVVSVCFIIAISIFVSFKISNS
jgi:E3 ubiquitin-protein ligase RNF13